MLGNHDDDDQRSCDYKRKEELELWYYAVEIRIWDSYGIPRPEVIRILEQARKDLDEFEEDWAALEPGRLDFAEKIGCAKRKLDDVLGAYLKNHSDYVGLHLRIMRV